MLDLVKDFLDLSTILKKNRQSQSPSMWLSVFFHCSEQDINSHLKDAVYDFNQDNIVLQ
jgi:hypothetical protein